jgi:hypothetical protein
VKGTKGTNLNSLEDVKEEAQKYDLGNKRGEYEMAHNMKNWTTHKEIKVNTWWVDFSNDKVSLEW